MSTNNLFLHLQSLYQHSVRTSIIDSSKSIRLVQRIQMYSKCNSLDKQKSSLYLFCTQVRIIIISDRRYCFFVLSSHTVRTDYLFVYEFIHFFRKQVLYRPVPSWYSIYGSRVCCTILTSVCIILGISKYVATSSVILLSFHLR